MPNSIIEIRSKFLKNNDQGTEKYRKLNLKKWIKIYSL